jgi:hypothetical protein
MEKDKTEIAPNEAIEKRFSLGRRLGQHDAFNAVSNRCSAADAETLREIRDSGLYKETQLNWDEFCRQHVGVSRSYADRLIRHLQEFGPNYFRLSELVEVSAGTYRLLAPAVSDHGLSFEGQTIPLKPENRKLIMAAVETVRGEFGKKPAAGAGFDAALKRLQAAVDAAERSVREPHERLVLVTRLHAESRRIDARRPSERR